MVVPKLVNLALLALGLVACGRGAIEPTARAHAWSVHQVVAIEGPGGRLSYQLARPGELLQLAWGRLTLRWPYRGGTKTGWRRRGRRFERADGELGLDLTALGPLEIVLTLRRGPPRLLFVILDAEAVNAKVVTELARQRDLRLILRAGAAPFDLGPLSGLGTTLRGLGLEDGVLEPDDLAVLAGFGRLEALSLRSSHLPSGLGASVGRLPKLRWLDLSFATVDAREIPELAAARRLEFLDLSGTAVAPTSLRWLGGLPGLRRLRLAHTASDNDTLAALPLERLEELDLAATRVTDAGVGSLQGSGLISLDLSDTVVTGHGLWWLPESLRILRLGPFIDDDALPAVATLRRLRVLTLRRSAISDLGLSWLGSLRKLRCLDLAWTAVTPAGVRSLRRAIQPERVLLGHAVSGAGGATTSAARRAGGSGRRR